MSRRRPPLPPEGGPENAANSAFSQRTESFARLDHALTRVVRLTRPRLHRPALAGVAGPPLDPAAYATLLWLAEREGCRLGELAALLGVDVSTASRQVRTLELAGLVECRRDPGDQRAKQLNLTATGAALLADARSAREEALVELLGGWEGEEVDSLALHLERLAEALRRPDEELEMEEAR